MKPWKNRGSAAASLMRLGQRGFAVLEIVLLLVVIGIIGANIIYLQNSTWKRTRSSNRLLIAGQMIEKQIEKIRMRIDADPKNNFPPVDSSFTENGITLSWKILPATRLNGSGVTLPHVRRCEFTAQWGKSAGDTLKVCTYLAKSF